MIPPPPLLLLPAGWVNRFRKEVRRGSTAYADLYVQVPYGRDNPYQNQPLLPLNIVPRLTPSRGGKAAQQRECSGCKRQLKEGCSLPDKKYCYVCNCIRRKLKITSRW
jgi:hypothetical protein